jgi:hypothetical protein
MTLRWFLPGSKSRIEKSNCTSVSAKIGMEVHEPPKDICTKKQRNKGATL